MDDLQKVAFYFLVTICSAAGMFGLASYLFANMVYREDKEGKEDKKDKGMDVKVGHLIFQHFLHIFLQADCSVAIENTIPHEAVPLVTQTLVRGGEEVGVRINTRSKWSMSLGSVTISARETFPSSKLPSKREVLERMIWFLVPRPKGSFMMTSKEWAAQQVTEELCEHWIWCNIYPKHVKHVTGRILQLYNDFKKLQSVPKARMTEKWVKEKVEPWLKSIEEGMDIRTSDKDARKKQEEIHGVKETEDEEAFWQDQMIGKRVGHCETFVDRKWLALDTRRKKDKESYLKRLENAEKEKKKLEEKVEVPLEFDEVEMTCEENDEVYMESEETTPCSKRRKRTNVLEGSLENRKSLPADFRHIRRSIKCVRPEYYTAVDRCISELHMSKEQAIGSTIIIAKELFNLKWKKFDDDEDTIDLDTVPDKKQIRTMGKAREALALNCLVEKIMSSDEKTTVVYHDDGSKKQGAGSFSVQGATINKKFYPFPTLSISSETRENLSQLKLTVLAILSTVSGVSSQDLWHRIDFTMTDSTIHNMKVDDLVSTALGIEHTPTHLLCQVHPACMFTRCLQKLCKNIDTTIGPNKIFSAFAVSLSDVQESVVEQWMNCLTRLVTHDFDHKSWNYAEEFDIFISPLKNPAKRLQKERFNSLNYTALITLYLDNHVTNFLGKFTNITNSLACIIRSFEGLEYLRVLAAVKVVVGVHLVEPYLSLTTSSSTSWEKLVQAFPTLYNDLTSTPPMNLLDLSSPAFSFISEERFKQCLYPTILLEPTLQVIQQYRGEVCRTLELLLPTLASGWERQRGDMFEFGNSAKDESTMKIKNMNQEKLEMAPVHNLDSERAVGSVNYGLKVRGAKELKAVSSSLVKAKAAELTEGKEVTKVMKNVMKKGGGVPQILEAWEEKQKKLKKEGMDAKEIASISQDRQRNSDLNTLTSMGGPFTQPEQVEDYIEDPNETEEAKIKRLYVEVRHAKNSSLSFPKSSDLFRLKRKGKNLTSAEYAGNLTTYLGRISTKVNMGFYDFQEALSTISKG